MTSIPENHICLYWSLLPHVRLTSALTSISWEPHLLVLEPFTSCSIDICTVFFQADWWWWAYGYGERWAGAPWIKSFHLKLHAFILSAGLQVWSVLIVLVASRLSAELSPVCFINTASGSMTTACLRHRLAYMVSGYRADCRRRAMGRSTLDQIISSEATCFYTLCWTAGLIRSHCLGCITFVCWIVSRLLHQHRPRIDDDSMPETPPSVHGLWLPGGLPAESDGQEHFGSNYFIWSYMLLYSLLDCRFDPFSLSWLHHVCLLNCLPSASSTPPQDRWRQHAWDTS